MKVGVVFKGENEKAKDLASKIIELLKQKGCEVLDEGNLEGSQYVISLGGDGTLIHEACAHPSLDIPFIGINTGNLGFLTAVESDDWEKAVDMVMAGEVVVSDRITLECETSSKKGVFRAVNEFAIKSQFRVVDLDIKVNGGELLKVYGDGVIIATQSGSTAYSLSAGGPIVDPGLDCLLVTPINPIGLPIPSVLLSPDMEVEVKVTKGEDVSLVIDGQDNFGLKKGDIITIKRALKRVKFGYFDKEHFLKSLNAKFGLSGRRIS
ncbi:MAG: putative inorganic polyphosphate/ATP-NAD kinase [Candidatus Curtissbacteria bacterium GW2011_GWA1_40_16]|uniref:NAD kinase n=1 Tax=Candidatus Curtissbacteria bacterium GW2011_GWA1_40_16 TaxID=1618405 RepID=A0A0G0RMK8_9BACT|nr:MAG: putative inorganic polyphosphate/ATP-NAD kinase [Candidatus Curtissbacteria bacterium GW2011_GWA1_40_16]